MRALGMIAVSAIVALATPASAGWRAANRQVTEAAKNPRIAAVLASTERMDRTILAHDVAAFGASFADDSEVNNPFNRIARKSGAEANLRTGLIDYTTLDRSIEYAALRGDQDVVLMGRKRSSLSVRPASLERPFVAGRPRYGQIRMAPGNSPYGRRRSTRPNSP